MFTRGIVSNLAVIMLLTSSFFSVQTTFAYTLDPGTDGVNAADGDKTVVSSGDNQFVTSDGMVDTDGTMSDGSDNATAVDSSSVSSDDQTYVMDAQNYTVYASVYSSVYYASLAVAATFDGSDITGILASSSQKLFDQAKDANVSDMFDDYTLLANSAGVPDVIKSKAKVKLQLKRTITKMHSSLPVTIICLGSSSTQGYPDYGAANPSQTYPSQLQAKLQESYPSSKITVVNRGIGGITASSMINNFASSVFAQNPDLVIWQTGTIEALNHKNYNVYLNELKTGTQSIASHGYDVALLDSQYYPGFGENDLFRNYVSAMEVVGKQMNVPVFHRYDYMRQLVQAGTYSWNSLLNTDHFHPSALMHQLTSEYITDLLR